MRVAEAGSLEILNERHKQALRFLVKASRDGHIPEEFKVFGLTGKPVIGLSKGRVEAPALSHLTLEVLADEGLVYSRVQTYTRMDSGGSGTQRTGESSRTCYITPAGFRAVDSDFAPIVDVAVHRPPIEITESLAEFRGDFPDSTRVAFIMMQFGSSNAHDRILTGITSALDPHGMVALRADDKQYHDDLYYNILTYIHGCRFGIAVFERIEEDSFNPNVSLEVGYMLGLRKSGCFLKDKTLHTLHTDLIGKLYRSFDPQDPEGTIPTELFAWMDQRGFIVRR